MTLFDQQLDAATISLMVGIAVGLFTIFVYLRNMKREHKKDLQDKELADEKLRKNIYESVVKTLQEKMEIQSALKELRDHIDECNEKIERLENKVFHYPRESNPNAWE